MHTQSTDQNFDSEDFQEAPLVARANGLHPFLIGVCGALFGLLFAVVLVRGSMPEMTPEQIVAMEGYGGRQPPRHIFNLDSLGSSSISSNVSRELIKRVTTSADSEVELLDESPLAAQFADDANQETGSVPATDALLLDYEEPNESWPLEIIEVPASPIIVGKDAQDVAAPVVEEFDYRALNRQSNEQIPNVRTISESALMSGKTDQSETTTIKVLPVLMVKTDNTFVRAEPTQGSTIKLVLARGSSVTAFEQSGAWVHVGANDGSSITGYVHQSKIAVTEIN